LSYKERLVHLKDEEAESIRESFTLFYRIIRTLRSPEGCPWDRKQTPESLGPNLLEEAYELIDAIENNDFENIEEEIGDILLVTLMIAYIFEQKEKTTLSRILDEISAKLIRRHPHVFGDVNAEDPDEVIKLLNHIKTHVEKNGEKEESILGDIPRTMPPLERAYKIQKRAAKHGFDWKDIEGVFGKIHEEIDELKDTLKQNDQKREIETEEELGDLLFSVINVSRFLKKDPAIALHRTNKKFIERFNHIEGNMKNQGLALSSENFEKMDELWEEAKRIHKNKNK